MANPNRIKELVSLHQLCFKTIGRNKDSYASFNSLDVPLRQNLQKYFQERYLLDNCNDICKFLDAKTEYLQLNEYFITDDSFLQITNLCPNLKTIILTYLQNIKPETYTEAFSKFTCLTEISFNACVGINDSVIRAISNQRYAYSLQSLFIDRCRDITDDSLIELFSKSKELRTLSLQSLKITDKCIECLCDGGTKLVSVNLNFCDGITDSSLTALSKCTNLEEILLSSCSRVTDEGVDELVSKCSKITALNLGRTSIGDTSLMAISQLLPNLVTLDIRALFHVTKDTINEILFNCCKLQNLNISDSGEIDDDSMQLLAHSNPNLEFLDISDCEEITDEGVAWVISNCKLKSIKLNGTSVSKRGLQQWSSISS